MLTRFFRVAILMACFLYAGSAFAAGGTCPSGTNYINSSGQSVTLAQLGILECYYIAANGSDSNSGTSESSPWRFAPGMANYTGSYHRIAGDAFIFRGGDTWHFGDSTQVQGGTSAGYAGVVTGCDYNDLFAAGFCLGTGRSITRGIGTATNPIYYGVDLGWYSGSAWTRPILTGDNPATTSNALTSCAYQVGANNTLVDFGGPFPSNTYQIFDNFELAGLCQAAYYVNGTYTRPNGSPGGGDFYIEDADLTVYIERVYMHNFSHIGFKVATKGVPACFISAGLLTGHCFAGVVIDRTGNVIQSVVDGSDSDPQGWTAEFGHSNASIKGGWHLAQSIFRYVVGIDMGPMHTIHDNLFEYIVGAGDGFAHSNILESSGDGPNVNAFYDNVFHDVCSGKPVVPQCASIGWWLHPPPGSTDYIFNNLTYNAYVANGNYFNVGAHATEGNTGLMVIFNNTFEQPLRGQAIITCSSEPTTYSLTLANNHYIIDGTTNPYFPACAAHETGVPATELIMTHAAAIAAGYTSAQKFLYSPTSGSSPTVRTGTNKQTFCSALATAAASDPTLSDAAMACQSDTHYACVYNTSNHTVGCPSRTPVVRPSEGAWDVGGFQFGGALDPPTGLTAAVE